MQQRVLTGRRVDGCDGLLGRVEHRVQERELQQPCRPDQDERHRQQRGGAGAAAVAREVTVDAAALGRRCEPRGEQRRGRSAAHLLQQALGVQKPLGRVVGHLARARRDVHPPVDLRVRRCTRAALAAVPEAHGYAAGPPELRVVLGQARQGVSQHFRTDAASADATRKFGEWRLRGDIERVLLVNKVDFTFVTVHCSRPRYPTARRATVRPSRSTVVRGGPCTCVSRCHSVTAGLVGRQGLP